MMQSPMQKFVLSGLGVAAAVPFALAQTPTWHRQIGTHGTEQPTAAAQDGTGGAFAVGFTLEPFGGPPQGGYDAWIARFDGQGELVFLHQMGSAGDDFAYAAASDGAGGVFVGGGTTGAFAGPFGGQRDAWLARYDAGGKQMWSQQLGTDQGEEINAAAPDALGGVYVTGRKTEGLFVARFDGAGQALWIRNLGNAYLDTPTAAAPDGLGGVYVAGWTMSDLGGVVFGQSDAWLARFDAAGNELWVRQIGTESPDMAKALATGPGGSVFIGGDTYGSLGGPQNGLWDRWFARYDSDGNQLWVTQKGTPEWDEVTSASSDDAGGVYFTGVFSNSTRPWIEHMDANGNSLQFQEIVSTFFQMRAYCLTPDGHGGVLFTGDASFDFGGPHVGYYDLFQVRYVQMSGAASQYCTAQPTSNGCVAEVLAVGAPSVSAPEEFQVFGSQLESAKNGLLFFGTTGPASIPFLGATLCVNPPLYRAAVQGSQGGFKCTGSLVYDFEDFLSHSTGGSLLAPGVAVHTQMWFRDPPAAFAAGLSSGLEFTVLP